MLKPNFFKSLQRYFSGGGKEPTPASAAHPKHYPIIFCDLDGTLIETRSGNRFPNGVWDMVFRLDVFQALRQAQPKSICIVSNQGGIEKGFVDPETFHCKMKYIVAALHEYTGAEVIAYTCVLNDRNHPKRKPNTGMLQEFINEDLPEDMRYLPQLMIGDASGKPGDWSDTDKKCAENFGIDYMDVEDFVNTYF